MAVAVSILEAGAARVHDSVVFPAAPFCDTAVAPGARGIGSARLRCGADVHRRVLHRACVIRRARQLTYASLDARAHCRDAGLPGAVGVAALRGRVSILSPEVK